jgi:uracil-DNA glycosylase family 4
LADVFLLKYSPKASELDEGVAFYGRAGEAILASVQRLNLNPLDLYGTNCIKCSATPTACQIEKCPGWLRSEISIVEPRLIVLMGEASVQAVNALNIDDARELVPEAGRLQQWTHTCDAVWCPDIDDCLDRPVAKQAFWRAFRTVGEWYADRPPW